MKVKEITLSKRMKVGLPNFSNIDIGMDITFQLDDGEKPDWPYMWDEVNKQLSDQSNGIDPAWMSNKEYKNFFKTTIKSPKEKLNDK